MEVALPVGLMFGLALACFWMAIRTWQEPRRPSQKGDTMAAIIGNTMAVRTTKNGKTVILTGSRPQNHPEPDGFIE